MTTVRCDADICHCRVLIPTGAAVAAPISGSMIGSGPLLDFPMVTLPNLQRLRFLCALAEQGHFGRAAERCAVTQSTLSGGIKELATFHNIRFAYFKCCRLQCVFAQQLFSLGTRVGHLERVGLGKTRLLRVEVSRLPPTLPISTLEALRLIGP
jgi:hypothetical protein